MVTAILFDLYETLVTERDAAPVRASSLGPRLGLDAAAFRKAWKSRRPRIVRGQLSFADALLEIGAGFGRELDPALVRRLGEERRVEKAAILRRSDPAALNALRRLRSLGFRLAVVSNGLEEDVDAWPGCPAAGYFHARVFSCAVGSAKPEPQIYLEAVRRLGVDSADALYIGDGGDDELAGAERAGLRAARASWFRGELAGLPPHVPRLQSWRDVIELATANGQLSRYEPPPSRLAGAETPPWRRA